jgi:hypothetical protein
MIGRRAIGDASCGIRGGFRRPPLPRNAANADALARFMRMDAQTHNSMAVSCLD